MDLETFTRRFSKKYAISDKGCWVWKGWINTEGYARCQWKGRPVEVHRLSYMAFKGEIPKGLEIDHLCRVRACINPDHLEAVTHRENMLRGVHFPQKDYCKRGHEYAKTRYVSPTGNSYCRLCDKIRHSKAYKNRKLTA